MITPQTFRAAFIAFGDEVRFPDPTIQFWIGVSEKMLDAGRWGDLHDHGAMLFVAHNVLLQSKDDNAANIGAAFGGSSGVVTSKSVDKVSISYDASSVAEEKAGVYNLTRYGQQFIRLARMVGMGPVQIDVPAVGQSLYGSAYAGPNMG